MMSTVVVVATSLSFSVLSLLSLIVDVVRALMMLLCTAVSRIFSLTTIIMYVIDTTRIWNSSPLAGMIRLQGGTYSNAGRIEVYCNGQWGTICDDGFGSTDARTICKQLGYNNYYRYDHLSL